MLYYKSLLFLQKPVKPIFTVPGGAAIGAWANRGKIADANFAGGECWLIEDTNYPADGMTFRIYYVRRPSPGYQYRVRFRFMTSHTTQMRFSLCTTVACTGGVYYNFDQTFTAPQPSGTSAIGGLDYFDMTIPNHLPNQWLRLGEVTILPVKL